MAYLRVPEAPTPIHKVIAKKLLALAAEKVRNLLFIYMFVYISDDVKLLSHLLYGFAKIFNAAKSMQVARLYRLK